MGIRFSLEHLELDGLLGDPLAELPLELEIASSELRGQPADQSAHEVQPLERHESLYPPHMQLAGKLLIPCILDDHSALVLLDVVVSPQELGFELEDLYLLPPDDLLVLFLSVHTVLLLVGQRVLRSLQLFSEPSDFKLLILYLGLEFLLSIPVLDLRFLRLNRLGH